MRALGAVTDRGGTMWRALALAATLVFSGCGSTAPTPLASPPDGPSATPAPPSSDMAQWRAAVGPGGSNGVVTLGVPSVGSGTLAVALGGLRPESDYRLRIADGTCAAEGTTIYAPAGLRSSADGRITTELAVPTSSLEPVRASRAPLTVWAGQGPALRCGVLTGGPAQTIDDTPGCVTDAPTAASSQTRARVGAYYFDGWTGPLSNFHFNGLLDGEFADRQPIGGWLDPDPCTVEQQLATARSFGLGYFVYDWYFGAPGRSGGENLNSALRLTASLRDRHGMGYAIHYVNHEPFGVSPADWPTAVEEWVSYFRDPAHVRVNDKPLFVVLDPHRMRAAFGSWAAVEAAFTTLRQQAQAAGLPGVTIVGNMFAPSVGDAGSFAGEVANGFEAEGYDAITQFHYAYSPVPSTSAGRPFSTLADAARWQWSQAVVASPLPFIPMVMPGWDPRPWNEADPATGEVLHYTRSPEEVAALVGEAVEWADAQPRLRLEPSPTPPLVLLQSWNELGEGAYLLPTVGDGRSYGDALGSALTEPPNRDRSVLLLVDDRAGATTRQARGTLSDSAGHPISGAPIALSGLALDGDGIYGDYTISNVVPARATRALVGFYAGEHVDGTRSSGECDIAFYRASFRHTGGVERVANGDFSEGDDSWMIAPAATLTASDRGAGSMVRAITSDGERAILNSAPFAVAAVGTAFEVSFTARVAPRCRDDGYFTVIFLDETTEVWRFSIPFATTPVSMGSTTTGSGGAYSFDLAGLGGARVTFDASYPGDHYHLPAWTRAPG